MSKQAENSLFIISPLANTYTEFYQHLLRGLGSYEELGTRLIHLAEQAHAFRQFDQVKEIGQVLSHIPIQAYQSIGYYFLAVAANSKGNGNQDEARELYELAADTAPSQYRAKAILSLAAVSFNTRDFDSAFRYYQEASKAGQLSIVSLQAIRGIALLKSNEGYHDHSLKDLESVLPIAKYAAPHIYFDYLNSLAVELGEAGRKYEARNVIKHVIASPFALAYPEWQDTARDLREPNRSFVTVPSIQRQIVQPKHVETPKLVIKPKQPASVLTFPKLREAPLPEKPERLSAREFGRMTARQKKELFMTALRTDVIRESEYDSMASMFGLLEIDPADRVIDLEDIATLEDIIAVWCNMIEPDQFATVMSALRDCDDDWRQHNIIDNMITIAFQQTRSHSESEQEWRSKVEARLPEK